ncbi:MAG: peptidoglycan-binding protein [Spirochaetaceae bacterium]|jgi:hypothetical protein|nr:peptidoglycan-binding protein [Spirochaetaceae bacterium]
MNCNKVLDFLYYSDEGITFVKRILIYLHTRHCTKCAAHLHTLQTASALLKEDFFPPAENIADSVMTIVRVDEPLTTQSRELQAVSLRAWIITGFTLLLSLSSAYLGIDYLTPMDTRTVNFMLPVGITVGGAITAFCAIFIGCHIKELSKWLDLHLSTR